MTVIPVIKILAVLGAIIGIYFFLEEQMDLSIDPNKGKDSSGNNSRYLQSITGANLEDQLIEVLLMISSSLKAGRNLDQAFELVAVSTPPPICNEFRTLVQERRLGVPMVEALSNLVARVPSQDLRLAVNATIFQQETGGNLEDLYRQIVLTVAERKKIMGKVVAGTAHARLSGNLVGSIPLFLSGMIVLFDPKYLMPMFENPYGQIVLIVSISASIIGLMIINRMTSSILPDAEEAVVMKNEARARAGRERWKLLRLLVTPLSYLNGLMPRSWIVKQKNEVKFLLEASNKAPEFTPEEYLGIMQLSSVLFVLLVWVFLNPISIGVAGLIAMIMMIPIGYRLPRIYLAHLIKKRQRNIEFELPYVIDLLSLAIESGLDLTGGIAKVVEKSRNTDIVVEFKMFLADTKIGKSLEEALADMAERVRVLSFFSFVSSLIQAQRLGAEIGPTLRAQAEQMRYQRMILAEERVNKLPVKLLIPLVFFVFPSISVILVGPALLQIADNFPKFSSQAQAQPVNDLKTGFLGQSMKLDRSIEEKKIEPASVTGSVVQPKKNVMPGISLDNSQAGSPGNKQMLIEVAPVVPPVPVSDPIPEESAATDSIR